MGNGILGVAIGLFILMALWFGGKMLGVII